MNPLPLPPDPNPYTVRSRRMIHETAWVRLREDVVDHRSGARSRDYCVLGFKNAACGVLALDADDRVVLVGQWRYPLERYSWEIVEGGGAPHESPFECLQRELAEEAGLRAEVWEPLAFHHTSNSSTDEECFLMLATDLHPADAEADDDEEFLALRIPFTEALRRVLQGEITDGPSVVALLALQARRSGVSAPLDPKLAERFFQRPQDHPSPGRARWNNLVPEARSPKPAPEGGTTRARL